MHTARTLLCTSIFTVLFGCASAQPASSPTTHQRPQQSAAVQEEGSVADWWMVRLAGLAIIVAAVQGGLFVWQLVLMRRAAEDSRRAAVAAERSVETISATAKAQLRAYVVVTGGEMAFPEIAKPSATIVVKNTGTTPALNVRHWIHQWAARYPLEVELPEPPSDFVMASDVLGAGGWHTQTNTHPGHIMKPGYMHEVGTAEATIYVYGEVRYDDVFGDSHITRYRYMYGGSEPAEGGRLRPCPEGNVLT